MSEMNTTSIEQSTSQPVAANNQNQQQMVNNNGNSNNNTSGSSAGNSIWGFSSQANGSNSTSTGDQQSNKLSSLWSLQWSENPGNECSVSNVGESASTPSNPPGSNVWGMGSALEDIISRSNGNSTNGSDKTSGNEPQSLSVNNSCESGTGAKPNWPPSSNPGDSPNAGGGNSGVISPGGSSNGSVSGSSDSKLISQWIGDSSSMTGGDTPSSNATVNVNANNNTTTNNVSSASNNASAWGSSNSVNPNTSTSGVSNWGPAGNATSEASGSWQQQGSQPSQNVGDQSWNNQGNSRGPRSYSQAAIGNASQNQQGQAQPVTSANQSTSQQGAVGSTSSPCSPPAIESFIDTRRDDEMRQMIDNCDGWGQRSVNQETTWDVEDIPEAKPKTDENPNVWPTFVNKGTNGWEESCRRRKGTHGGHVPSQMASGWGDSHSQHSQPAKGPTDSWNKWSGSAAQTPSNQSMPWTSQSGHGNLDNRMSGGNWVDDGNHRSVPSSRDESPMGPPSSNMWPSEQASGNWNRGNVSGIGTWQQTVVTSPTTNDRVSSWNDGSGGQWSNSGSKNNRSSSGDSVTGDYEFDHWNSASAKDNDYGDFDDMLPKHPHRWSSASVGQSMPSSGGPQRRIKSEVMMPDSGFGPVNPQRSALTESLMQLGVSKDDATKALINSVNDYAQAIRWLVQQGKLAPSILNSPVAMAPRTSHGDMFGGNQYPSGSPNHMNQQQQVNISLQDRIRIAQQRSQIKLNGLPPSSNQVIVEQLRKAVHQGYLNQHVLNMQLSQDVLKLIHDLINHQIVLEQVQRDEQGLQQQQMQMTNKFPPMSPQAQALDQQRQALQHEMCRLRLIMEQRKMQIAQRTGTTVAPTPGVPVSGAQSPVGGQSASSSVSSAGGRQQQGRQMPPTNDFGHMSLGSGAHDQQSKLSQWRTQGTPERSTPNDNWATAPNNSGFSPTNNDGRAQQGMSGAPAVVEFVPGKPWAGLSMQSTDDDPHMTPASAAKPPLAIGSSDSYLDTLAKSGPTAHGQHLIGGQPRMSSLPSPAGSSSSPRPTGSQSWGNGSSGQMQYGGNQRSQQQSNAGNWGGSPWGTGASMPMAGNEFLPWGLTAGSSGNNSASGFNTGSFM